VIAVAANTVDERAKSERKKIDIGAGFEAAADDERAAENTNKKAAANRGLKRAIE
jgi:hypothetical protein